MGDIRQANFRVDQDTADRFRSFCEENGLNQAQGFDHIMQIVELDKAKAVTPDRVTEIESFEKSVKDIMAAYLTSIEINDNAEARIREQFASDLLRKDKTIDELREKIGTLQIEKDEATLARDAAIGAQAQAEERAKTSVEQMEAAKKTASDQERINAMLTTQLADATGKLDGYDALKASESDLSKKLEETIRSIADYKKDAEMVLKEAKAEAQRDKERALEEKERELTEQKTSAEAMLKQVQTQAELDKERAVMAKEREISEQLKQSDIEHAASVAKLNARIELLENEINKSHH